MNLRSISLLLLSAALFSSCLKKEYDAPPDTRGYDPGLPVNMTIRDLKAKFSGPSASAIDSDWTIYGIVTADDRSGNLYKQINIEDSTGGITLLLDNTGLYGDYPAGRKVYVKLKGLYYGYYNNYPQIGAKPGDDGDLTNIAPAAIDDYVVKASFPNEVKPQTFSDLAQLKTVNNGLLNRLVRIENVEFLGSDTAKTYAEAPTVSSGTDRKIQDCFGNTVVVRTSGYASFQGYRLPKGKGALTAVYSVYRSTVQLIIVDTADVDLYGPRCGSGPAPELTRISIDSLRKIYSGTAVTMGSVSIAGTVISDRANENIDGRNMVMQSGGRGIVIRFSSIHSFNLGDSVVVNLAGGQLSEFSGLLQAGSPSTSVSFPLTNCTVVGTGKSVVPQVLTIAAITGANFESLESTLVRIQNATISGGTTFATATANGSRTLNDGTGTITLFTDKDASFALTAVPTAAADYTGIIGQFSTTKQISIRNGDDIE